MKAVGIVFVVLGVVFLLYGGISWTYDDKVIDAGPLEVTVEREKRVPVPPIIGGVLLVAGSVILLKGRGRS